MTMTDQSPSDAPQHGCPSCHGPGHHPAAERQEPERERLNRRWNEILQETRVAQTGVQILFGFLLSVAFTPYFQKLETFDHVVYVITVILGASGTGALIAPVSIHRLLSGQRMKSHIVEVAGRLMVCGLVLLALTIGGTLLLLLHVVVPGLLAELLVGGVMLWFALCWYGLPVWLRRRSTRDDPARGPDRVGA
ncbi:DUF6328 family protein [Streptomyces sp. NPDC055794]